MPKILNTTNDLEEEEIKTFIPKYLYKGPFEKTIELAEHYGFNLIAPPSISRDDNTKAKSLINSYERKHFFKNRELSISPEDRNALFKFYSKNGFEKAEKPLMLCYTNHSSDKKILSQFRLDVLGIKNSSAEAVLIKTAISILNEFEHKDFWVDINSIGDKEATVKFSKEVGMYYRQFIEDIPNPCRQHLSKNPLKLLECTSHDKCKTIKEEAPKAISFLPEKSRLHLEEVLECLESMDVPYRINNELVGSKHYSSEVLFRIKSQEKEEEKTLTIGERFDGLARRLGYKQDIPGVGETIGIPNLSKIEKYKEITRKDSIPRIYFIQLGFEARVKGLYVIETLQKKKVSVVYSIGDDHLTSQLESADKLEAPYIVIMGQREALEDSVIVRNRESRFQETVRIDDLVRYINRLK